MDFWEELLSLSGGLKIHTQQRVCLLQVPSPWQYDQTLLYILYERFVDQERDPRRSRVLCLTVPHPLNPETKRFRKSHLGKLSCSSSPVRRPRPHYSTTSLPFCPPPPPPPPPPSTSLSPPRPSSIRGNWQDRLCVTSISSILPFARRCSVRPTQAVCLLPEYRNYPTTGRRLFNASSTT